MKDPYENSRSYAFRMRQRRFRHLQGLIDTIFHEKGECSIIDLGGTQQYWRISGDLLERPGLSITLVNIQREPVSHPAFKSIAGNVTELAELRDSSFDLVHSNSVIEHVGEAAAMEKMARNVRRLAPRYFLQTPDYWFPIEPHFRFPAFQWLPEYVRCQLLMRATLGWRGRQDSYEAALAQIRSVRLLTRRELAKLFPDARIVHERILGISKSLMAIRA